jgi:hypothetical protein
MPKRLVERLRSDSIHEFRCAAKERIADGDALAAVGRGLAAIYLWGYAAEMALKASFFEASLYNSRRPIEKLDLHSAKPRAAKLGVAWPPGSDLHDVAAWAELVVAERSNRGTPLGIVAATKLIRAAQSLRRLWRVTLRYHANRAYSNEVEQVRQLVRQILSHCNVR